MKLFNLKKDDYFCFKGDMTEAILPVYRVIRGYQPMYGNIQFFNIRTGSTICLDSNAEVYKLLVELKWRFYDND